MYIIYTIRISSLRRSIQFDCRYAEAHRVKIGYTETQIVHLLCMKYGYNHYTPMVQSFFVSQLFLYLPLLSHSTVFLFIFIVLNCTN